MEERLGERESHSDESDEYREEESEDGGREGESEEEIEAEREGEMERGREAESDDDNDMVDYSKLIPRVSNDPFQSLLSALKCQRRLSV
jgi:hypothetical protein